MISKVGQKFLRNVLKDASLEHVVSTFAYSERITIAFDLHVLIKTLLNDVENFAGEPLYRDMFQNDGSH